MAEDQPDRRPLHPWEVPPPGVKKKKGFDEPQTKPDEEQKVATPKEAGPTRQSDGE